MRIVKVLDLFSGIGGFSIGLEKAGFETVAFCEIDPDARQGLKKHWPGTHVFTDVSKLGASEGMTGQLEIGGPLEDGTMKVLPGDLDMICGGFQCQDISVAGLKKGFEHITMKNSA